MEVSTGRFVLGLAYLVLILVLPSPLVAQPQIPEAPQVKHTKKLHWWIGEWKDEGWAEFGGQRHTFRIREKVASRLDGLILSVEGLGTSHDCFFTVSKQAAYSVRKWNPPSTFSTCPGA